MKSIQFHTLTAFLLLFTFFSIPPKLLHSATTTWPSLMNYQGHLNTAAGVAVADGSYTIVFNIYNVATGGSPLWGPETQTVSVSKGLFNAVLGSVTPISLSNATYVTDLWIGITVNTDAEMTPRQQLLPAANAKNAQALAGLVTGTAANNIVVLDGTGHVPAGLVQGSSVAAPFTLTGSSANFSLDVINTSASASATGIVANASNGISATASASTGYGIWGMTAPSDSASADGIFGSANTGIGVLAQSNTGVGLSVTSQSTSSPTLFSAGTFPAKFQVNTAASNNAGVMVSTVSGDKTVNLADHGNNAGVFVNVNSSGNYGVSSTASGATSIYGQTSSGSATDYGVWGNQTGNTAAGVGVFGTGFYGVFGLSNPTTAGAIGVQGWTAGNGGRAVEGDVSGTAIGSSIAIVGRNYVSNGTAILGLVSGTAGGVGIRGGASFSTGAFGVYGSVSGTGGSVGVEGFVSQNDGFGVIGIQGSSVQMTYSAGVTGYSSLTNGVGVRGEGGECGVCALNGNAIVYPSGTPSGVGLYANSPGEAVLAESTNTTTLGYGVYADTQSTYAGTTPAASSSAGYFVAAGASNGPNTGVYAANYSTNPTSIGIYATGYNGVWSSATGSTGYNFYSDGTNQPAFGFFHYGGALAPAGGVGVSAEEDCPTCFGGSFTNTLATNGSGAEYGALLVDGRIKIQQNTGAGTFVVPTTAFGTNYTFSNPYITVNCLIFMTPEAPTVSTGAVTSLSPGNATIVFSPALTGSSNFTFQYLIIGQ